MFFNLIIPVKWNYDLYVTFARFNHPETVIKQ